MHNAVLILTAVAAGFAVLYAIVARVLKKYRMRMITCVIRPEQLNEVTAALRRSGLMTGMTVMDVRGFGRQRGGNETSGNEMIRFLPKLKIEILVGEPDLKKTMDVISTSLHTGQIGDGKIIVFEAVSAMRIRTGEKGLSAL